MWGRKGQCRLRNIAQKRLSEMVTNSNLAVAGSQNTAELSLGEKQTDRQTDNTTDGMLPAALSRAIPFTGSCPTVRRARPSWPQGHQACKRQDGLNPMKPSVLPKAGLGLIGSRRQAQCRTYSRSPTS